jgi:hypothetical protein
MSPFPSEMRVSAILPVKAGHLVFYHSPGSELGHVVGVAKREGGEKYRRMA